LKSDPKKDTQVRLHESFIVRNKLKNTLPQEMSVTITQPLPTPVIQGNPFQTIEAKAIPTPESMI
jgi:hypothetical protein